MGLKTSSKEVYSARSEQNLHIVEQKTALKNSSRKTNRKISLKLPELRLRRRLVYPKSKKQESVNMVNIGPVLLPSILPVIPIMPQHYPYYPQPYMYPVTINSWNPVIQVNPFYALHHVPIVITPPATQALASCVCCDSMPTPLISPVTNEIKHGASENLNFQGSENPFEYLAFTKNDFSGVTSKEETENELNKQFERDKRTESLETYLNLPKELFPPAMVLKLDPNPLIDEFCKFCNIHNHAPWMLDLEFGIPKYPITRPIPMYNVKYNSVNCKNAPDAIHPGFECCSQDFKSAFLFYYDVVISNWYRGYTILSNDKSVENFQTWLLLPMQILGMCWP